MSGVSLFNELLKCGKDGEGNDGELADEWFDDEKDESENVCR